MARPAAMSEPGTLPAPPQEPEHIDQSESPPPGPPQGLRRANDEPVPEAARPDRRPYPGTGGDVAEGSSARPEALFPQVPAGTQAHLHIVHHVTETVERPGATHVDRRLAVPNDAAIMILPHDDNRRKAILKCVTGSAATISIGRNPNVIGQGADTFPLEAGQTLEINDRDWYWAIAEGAGSTILAMHVTRDSEDERGPGLDQDT